MHHLSLSLSWLCMCCGSRCFCFRCRCCSLVCFVILDRWHQCAHRRVLLGLDNRGGRRRAEDDSHRHRRRNLWRGDRRKIAGPSVQQDRKRCADVGEVSQDQHCSVPITYSTPRTVRSRSSSAFEPSGYRAHPCKESSPRASIAKSPASKMGRARLFLF
jgi:hypothetical protein